MSTTSTITKDETQVHPRPIATLLIWMLSFLSFPLGGLLGTTVVGRVDNLLSALVGGALVGAIVGLAQSLASRRSLRTLTWALATAVGATVGVAVGTLVVGYGTSLTDLIVGGLITGAVVGLAQAFALPRRTRSRWLWVPITTLLWSLGWAVTTVAGIAVEEQFIVFGASGAVVYTHSRDWCC